MGNTAIENVQINHFTLFDSFEMTPCSGINVIIGENGTGKTHLMKFIYAAYVNGDMDDYFPDHKLSKMEQEYKNLGVSFPFTVEMKHAVFIPAKDMLSHSKGFLSLYDKYVLPFDKISYDIISKSLFPQLRDVPEIGKKLLPKLENIMGGKVLIENEVFFIERKDGAKIPFSMESDGIKKFAMLWQLIMNDSITEKMVLFWDEAESNLNEKYIPDMVEIFCELARFDVQIFMTTHSGKLAECLDSTVLSLDSSTPLLFHRLYASGNEGVSCESRERFSDLQHHMWK